MEQDELPKSGKVEVGSRPFNGGAGPGAELGNRMSAACIAKCLSSGRRAGHQKILKQNEAEMRPVAGERAKSKTRKLLQLPAATPSFLSHATCQKILASQTPARENLTVLHCKGGFQLQLSH